ncbi:MAG: hypothetical protein R6V58_13885 [Planctomycetota bacterium]
MRVSRLPVPDRPYDGKGRVLRVKEGFNPNSSSLGSIVFSIPTALMAAPVVLGAAAAWIGSGAPKPKEATATAGPQEQEPAAAPDDATGPQDREEDR